MSNKPIGKDEIFDILVNIEDLAEREQTLERLCSENEELRNELSDYLNRDQQIGSFLDVSASGFRKFLDDTTRDDSELLSQSTIGDYRLIEKLGHGGMGAVFVAQQRQPVQRQVAIKLIKSDLESPEVTARFDAERQALALMEHPHIAKFFDAGTAADGNPYFVMEYVQGSPVTQFCDQNRLSIDERLGVFRKICMAVQHAHQKGIIHRDLKPSNILVAQVDDEVVPKIIDFGLAKATGVQLTVHTLHTQAGQVLGTLQYMSPEQTRGPADVDTRSDIYALGAVLYELLTGSPPFEASSFKGLALDEVVRIIREQVPPTPTRRLFQNTEMNEQIADRRKHDASKLASRIKGELEWIVMKALDKDLARRYESAGDLARDIRDYLDGQPVVAAPPSATYRLKKLIRRNRVAVTIGLIVAISLLATLSVLGISASMLTHTNQQLSQKSVQLQVAYEQQTHLTERANERFDIAMSVMENFHRGLTEDLLLRESRFKELRNAMLQRPKDFYTRLESTLAGDDSAAAKIALSKAYLHLHNINKTLGQRDQATEFLDKAVRVNEQLVESEPDNKEYLKALIETLIGRHIWLGKTTSRSGMEAVYEKSELSSTYEHVKRLWNLDSSDHAVISQRMYCEFQMAGLCEVKNNHVKSEEHKLEALALAMQLDPARIDHPIRKANSLSYLYSIGFFFLRNERLDEALSVANQLVEGQSKWVAASSENRHGFLNLAGNYDLRAMVHRQRGDQDSAIADLEASAEIHERLIKLVPNSLECHVKAGQTFYSLAKRYFEDDHLEDAQELSQKSLDYLSRALEIDSSHFNTLMLQSMCLSLRGDLLMASEEYEKAIEVFESVSHFAHGNDANMNPAVLKIALAQAKLGNVQAAALSVQEMTPNANSTTKFHLAKVLSECCHQISHDGNRPENGGRLVELYSEAVALLRDSDLQESPERMLSLKTDPIWIPLRDLPEFDSLIADMSKSTPRSDLDR